MTNTNFPDNSFTVDHSAYDIARSGGDPERADASQSTFNNAVNAESSKKAPSKWDDINAAAANLHFAQDADEPAAWKQLHDVLKKSGISDSDIKTYYNNSIYRSEISNALDDYGDINTAASHLQFAQDADKPAAKQHLTDVLKASGYSASDILAHYDGSIYHDDIANALGLKTA